MLHWIVLNFYLLPHRKSVVILLLCEGNFVFLQAMTLKATRLICLLDNNYSWVLWQSVVVSCAKKVLMEWGQNQFCPYHKLPPKFDRPKPRTSEKVSKLQIKITALFHKIGILFYKIWISLEPVEIDKEGKNLQRWKINFEILNVFLPKNVTTKGLWSQCIAMTHPTRGWTKKK